MKIPDEKAEPSRTLSQDDYNAAISYVNTYTFVTSTHDRKAAIDAIRKSELHHNSAYMPYG